MSKMQQTSIKVNFEIGHEASLRSKKSPEGFTHDWEVFVRGLEGADISHFVEKVVFHLHETFKKPRRVVKETPFSIKESGYAGFTFPIEIYLKNKDEPKKIQFSYDLSLQQSGSLKDRYIFPNPNEEFKKKLLKGGGIPVNHSFYTNPDQESRSRDSFTDEKSQIVSKPKVPSESVKKHKIKDHKDDIPHKTSSFENLFGSPIQKPPKVSPDLKKNEKTTTPVKLEKKEKERSSSEKKSKHEHKEQKSEKPKNKDEKDKNRTDKSKSHSKEVERSKEKSHKRTNERPLSPLPDSAKKRCLSPIKKPVSPPPRSSSASSIKDEYKPPKHNQENIDQKKNKIEEKPVEVKVEKDLKEKKKKEKKSYEKDKERREKKEHKKESHKSSKEPPKEIIKEITKVKEIIKEKDSIKELPSQKEKQQKTDKSKSEKFSIANLQKTPPQDKEEERLENHKPKDKTDSERKHKHKKKDKKHDGMREKHKESNKEKKQKHEKSREKPEADTRETPMPKERPIVDPTSPISIDTASQCSSKSGVVKVSHISTEDVNSSHSDSENSVIADEDDIKVKVEAPSPELKREPSVEQELEPEPEVEQEPEVEPELELEPAAPSQPKEKTKKHKDKAAKKEEKRRKRKNAAEEDSENRKISKTNSTGPLSTENEQGESSGSTMMETKVQDNGVSSSLGEDAEPGQLSPDYMVQLRGLQQRIMMIQNNEDLERVVNLIAETGRYEVTTQTFDFDLCVLDRSTVQQLIQLVGC